MLGASVADDLTLLAIAAVGIVPASIAAISSVRSGRKLKTGNGQDVGKYAVQIREEQVRIASALLDEREKAAVDRVERAETRRLLLEHLDADAAFQAKADRVFAHLAPAVVLEDPPEAAAV
jgi:hypothetical protein